MLAQLKEMLSPEEELSPDPARLKLGKLESSLVDMTAEASGYGARLQEICANLVIKK